MRWASKKQRMLKNLELQNRCYPSAGRERLENSGPSPCPRFVGKGVATAHGGTAAFCTGRTRWESLSRVLGESVKKCLTEAPAMGASKGHGKTADSQVPPATALQEPSTWNPHASLGI